MSKKLIKDLVINVSAKNIRGTTKDIEKLGDGLENAAAGADLLTERLEYVPEALKDIQKEAEEAAEDIDKIFRASGSGAIEGILDRMEDQLDAVIISLSELNDTLKTGFSDSTFVAETNTSELVAKLEDLDDNLMAVEKQTKRNKKANEDLTKSKEGLNRGLGRTNAQGRGQVRTFADIAKFAGPLPGLYAVIAANAFTLSEAFRLIAEGDQLNRLEQAGNIMGAQVGVPISQVAKGLQEAVGFAISYEEALRQASSASTFGFTAEQIDEMGLAARRASVTLGVDMQDALNRIIRGVSKLEIELLDELGITVRLTEAYDEYAKSVGKTANDLNGYQKQQAYLNAVLKESEKRQGAIDGALSATGWEKLGAAVSSATSRFKQWIAEAGEPAARVIAQMMEQDSAVDALESARATMETSQNAIDQKSEQGMLNSLIAIRDLRNEHGDLAKAIEETSARINIMRSEGGIADRQLRLEINTLEAYKEQMEDIERKSEGMERALLAAFGVNIIGKSAEELKDMADQYATIKQMQGGVVSELGDITKELESQTPEYVKIEKGLSEIENQIKTMSDYASRGDLLKKLGLDEAALSRMRNIASSMRELNSATMSLASRQASIGLRGVLAGQTATEISLQQEKLKLDLLKKQQAERIARDTSESGSLTVSQELEEISYNITEQATKILELERQQRVETAELAKSRGELLLAEKNINQALLVGAAVHSNNIANLQEEKRLTQELFAAREGVTPQEEVAFRQQIADIDAQIVSERKAMAELALDERVAMLDLQRARLSYNQTLTGGLSDLQAEANLVELELEHHDKITQEMKAQGITQAELTRREAEKLSILERQLQISRQIQADAISNAQEMTNIANSSRNLTSVERAELGVLQEESELRRLKALGSSNEALDLQRARIEAANISLENAISKIENYKNAWIGAKYGFEDTSDMNEEERMMSQFESGMRLYDQAFSSLSSINPEMGNLFSNFQSLTVAIQNMGDTAQGTWNAMGQGIQTFGSMMALASSQATSEIDKQIAAEKKRDGKSEESRRKIAKLEAKKQAEQKKAARMQIILNTAQAVMASLSSLGVPLGIPFAASAAAMGAMMLSQVNSGESISGVEESTPGKLELGKRDNTVDLAGGPNAGELAFVRGERGIGTAGNFAPRARGGTVGNGIMVGEHGPETIEAPALQGSKVTSTEEMERSSNKQAAIFQFNISAIDTQSIVDRSEDIFEALSVAASARGFSLGRG